MAARARNDGTLLNVSESPIAVEATAARPAATVPSGARSGALIAAASAVSIFANYVFLLAAGRILGSADYGSLAALLGLLAVVLLPAGALQMAVSREVSRLVAQGDVDQADVFARTALRLAVLGTAPLLAVALALAPPLASMLNIDSAGIVALAQITLATALVFPVAMGVLQGRQRFHALATIYVFPWVLRLAVLAAVTVAGYRLGGTIFATVVATFAATGAAVGLILEPRRASIVRPDLRPFLRYLGPVAVGIVGIALLTHVDILVVKARFSADDAGAYGAASAFARVAFFLPAALLSVLFPRTAARQARGEDTADILGRSLLATAGFCAALAVFYAAAGEGLVVSTFGQSFAPGGRVLAPFALAMGLFSLAQVLVGYHLSRGEARYAWIVAGGVVVQVTVLALVPTSLRGIVWADVVIGVVLLAAHELLVGSSVPAVRVGWRHFAAAAGVRLRPVAGEGALVLLGVTALVCALFWPVVTHLGSTVVGSGSDPAGTVWRYWEWQQEGGYHLFGTTHHTLTGAPFGWDESNGLNIQWLIPYYAGYLATTLVGAVAANNLVLLAGYVLSGAAMYLLVRYLGCARPVAAWAALVYVVFPWHLARTPHPSLVHLEFLPLVILAVLAAAERPTAVRFALVGAATLACWLTSGYFGVMAIVITGTVALCAALTSTRRRGVVLIGGAVGSALGASLVVAVLSVLSGVGPAAGVKRAAADLAVYGVRPLELLVPSKGSLLFGDRFVEANMHGSNPTETSNYLGLLTIALAAAWLVFAWRRWATLAPRLRYATVGLAGVLAVSLLLAAPSPIHVFGHSVWMPSRLVWQVVSAIRVPTRWIALAMTALVPIAALALQAAWRRLERRGRWRGAPLLLVAGAMLFSFVELTINPDKPRLSTEPTPRLYAALARTPPGNVAEYPLVVTNDHILWQILYRRPLLNQADFGTPADEARRVVFDPATPGAASTLALLGVTAIVTHRDALQYQEGVPETPNATWGPGYALVTRTPDGSSTWRVVARPAPALVTLTGGFSEPEAPKDNLVGYAFVSGSGFGAIDIRSKQSRLIRLVFDAEPPGNEQRVLRLANSQTERPFTLKGRTEVSLLVRVPRGLSRLYLKTDPPATSEDDAIVVSAPRAEAASSGEPELQPEVISPDPGF